MIKIRHNKAQAALEFIMTYGWAILVVLVAVGALAYFGVLSPDRFLPSKCTFQSGLACLDHRATPNALEVVLKNSLGYDITVTAVYAFGCTAQTGLTVSVANGDNYQATFACPTPLGSKYNGQVSIIYTTPSDVGGLTHNNTGQVTSKVG